MPVERWWGVPNGMDANELIQCINCKCRAVKFKIAHRTNYVLNGYPKKAIPLFNVLYDQCTACGSAFLNEGQTPHFKRKIELGDRLRFAYDRKENLSDAFLHNLFTLIAKEEFLRPMLAAFDYLISSMNIHAKDYETFIQIKSALSLPPYSVHYGNSTGVVAFVPSDMETGNYTVTIMQDNKPFLTQVNGEPRWVNPADVGMPQQEFERRITADTVAPFYDPGTPVFTRAYQEEAIQQFSQGIHNYANLEFSRGLLYAPLPEVTVSLRGTGRSNLCSEVTLAPPPDGSIRLSDGRIVSSIMGPQYTDAL